MHPSQFKVLLPVKVPEIVQSIINSFHALNTPVPNFLRMNKLGVSQRWITDTVAFLFNTDTILEAHFDAKHIVRRNGAKRRRQRSVSSNENVRKRARKNPRSQDKVLSDLQAEYSSQVKIEEANGFIPI